MIGLREIGHAAKTINDMGITYSPEDRAKIEGDEGRLVEEFFHQWVTLGVEPVDIKAVMDGVSGKYGMDPVSFSHGFALGLVVGREDR